MNRKSVAKAILEKVDDEGHSDRDANHKEVDDRSFAWYEGRIWMVDPGLKPHGGYVSLVHPVDTSRGVNAPVDKVRAASPEDIDGILYFIDMARKAATKHG